MAASNGAEDVFLHLIKKTALELLLPQTQFVAVAMPLEPCFASRAPGLRSPSCFRKTRANLWLTQAPPAHGQSRVSRCWDEGSFACDQSYIQASTPAAAAVPLHQLGRTRPWR